MLKSHIVLQATAISALPFLSLKRQPNSPFMGELLYLPKVSSNRFVLTASCLIKHCLSISLLGWNFFPHLIPHLPFFGQNTSSCSFLRNNALEINLRPCIVWKQSFILLLHLIWLGILFPGWKSFSFRISEVITPLVLLKSSVPFSVLIPYIWSAFLFLEPSTFFSLSSVS